jgi:hypothetical protein
LALLYGLSPATANVWAPRVVGVLLLALAGLGAVAGVVGLAVWAAPKPRYLKPGSMPGRTGDTSRDGDRN